MGGEEFGAFGGDLDDVFDAAAAEAGVIETGFDGDDGPGSKRKRAGGGETGSFVDGEAEPVAGAVEETGRTGFGARGFVAGGGEGVDDLLVNVAAFDAGADGFRGGELGGADGFDETVMGVGGASAEVSARHVAEVSGFCYTREDVDDDELVRSEGAVTALVRIAGLIAAGDNGGAVGLSALGHDGGFDGEAKTFGRERFTLLEKGAAANLGGTEDGFGDGETDGAEAIALADGGGFGGGFDFPFGEERTAGELEFQAEFSEAEEEGGRKVVGDAEGVDAVSAGGGGDGFGGADVLVREKFGGSITPDLEGEDGVEDAGFFDASEFEGGLEGDATAAGAEGDERIMDIDAAEVELVGAGDGVGVKERRK